jgi:hypothetical protein
MRPQPVSDAELEVLYDLRQRRKRHRLGDIEWFDAAYRVHLVALFGGGTVLWISSSIKDETVRPTPLPTSPERPGADRHHHRAGVHGRTARQRGRAVGARGLTSRM